MATFFFNHFLSASHLRICRMSPHFCYGVNAIQIQTWGVLIANLLITVLSRSIKRLCAFSQGVTMIRLMLMYHVDFIANRSLGKVSCHFLMNTIRKAALYMLDSHISTNFTTKKHILRCETVWLKHIRILKQPYATRAKKHTYSSTSPLLATRADTEKVLQDGKEGRRKTVLSPQECRAGVL